MVNAGAGVTGGTNPCRRPPENSATGSSAWRRGDAGPRTTSRLEATALRHMRTRAASSWCPVSRFPAERVSTRTRPSCGLTYTSVTSSSASAAMTAAPR